MRSDFTRHAGTGRCPDRAAGDSVVRKVDRDESDEMLPLLVLLGTIAGAWYLLIVRPQKDLQTRHGRLVERLQVGDHVLTVGGIYGRVAALEGASVVLELAPGLETRIATDGIARIVHGGEAALPTQTDTPRQALDTDMHQHPHSDQQQPQHAFAAPQYVAPQQPYAGPAPTASQHMPQHAPEQQVAQTIQMPAQPQHAPQYASPQPQYAAPQPHYAQHAPQYAAPQQYAAPVQLPAPPAPNVTMRAPVGSSIPTYEPRPWGDVAPTNAQPQHVAHQVQQHHAPVQQQYAPAAPQPMALHQPFAPQVQQYAPQPHAVQPQQYAVQPQQYAVQPQQHAMPPQQHAPQQYAQQPAMTMTAPNLAPATVQHVVHAPVAAAPMAEPTTEETRRHSRAPQGMGSSLRLDDPSISDTMGRAREERAGLADEYRKLTAPLVELDQPQHAHAVAPGQPQPQLVGHDPNGMPLFATPGAPPTHAIAQYPAPAHPQPAHAMPRPVVAAPHGHVDPALATSSAFQRSTPYTPNPELQPAHA
ncbi:MAG: preprotein translocase, YajC subunit [Thermoleophilia bacterium]|nr:preprotein translocase, YajC subunit [Thermoleophilia bacterium]